MKHLIQSFQEHVGIRGVHFYDDENCNFLTWRQVFKFFDELPNRRKDDEFTESLTENLANYDPDNQFLAVHQKGSTVSVELYTSPE
jgi:hypothetical protein